MKKSILLISLFLGTVASAQTKPETNLKQNMESIQALQELLSTEYTAISETKTVVPKNQFTWSNTTVFNAYGDVSAQEQAKALEAEFGATFNGSNWNFQPLDQVNGSQTVTITTVKGEKQTAKYTCSGAQFTSGNLIERVNFQAYLFQSKINTNEYILLFTISSGMTIVADFIKKQ